MSRGAPYTRMNARDILMDRVMVNGTLIQLTGLEARALRPLYLNRGRPVSNADLVDAMYGDREDGGPLYSREIFRLCMLQLRRKTGLDIRPHHHGVNWALN